MSDMVKVSGGSFLMGRGLSDAAILQLPRCKEVKDLEYRLRRLEAAIPPPMTKVFVSSFWMSRYPVTQREWEELSAANPSHYQGPDRPVECVS